MKAYRFRFEGLLKKKLIEERNIQNEMSPIVSKYNQILSKIEELNYNSLSLNVALPSPVSFNPIATLKATYIHTIKALKTTQASIDNQLKDFRIKLQVKIIERKAIELLKNKEYQTFLKKKNKNEQFNLEEHFNALSRRKNLE